MQNVTFKVKQRVIQIIPFGANREFLQRLLEPHASRVLYARPAYGQKIETAKRMEAVVEAPELGRRSGADFGCYSLMQHDVRRSVAALELLAGTAWAWIIAARIRRLAQLAQSLLWGAAGEPIGNSGLI